MAKDAVRADAPRVDAPRADAPRVWATRPFGYAGLQLDRGQVFSLGGHRNDEKLVGLGYVHELPAKATVHQCAVCGAEFIGISERTGHGDKRHRTKTLNPYQEDEAEDREEELLAKLAPLGSSS